MLEILGQLIPILITLLFCIALIMLIIFMIVKFYKWFDGELK